jgi:hypothetical protein
MAELRQMIDAGSRGNPWADAGTAANAKLASERHEHLAAHAHDLGWGDPHRRLSDRQIIDLIRAAILRPDGRRFARETIRTALHRQLGPGRSGPAMTDAERERASELRLKMKAAAQTSWPVPLELVAEDEL